MLDEITRQAAEIDADLMVLGARGAGFRHRIALGSMGESLVLLAACEVPFEGRLRLAQRR